MSTFFYVPQYFTTQLSVAGGIDDTQTTGIVLQDISGVDDTKPGIIALTWSNPIDTTKIEYIFYTSINDSTKELQGVTRGQEGYSAKSHLNGATVAWPLSKSHINNIPDSTTTFTNKDLTSETNTFADIVYTNSLARQAIINGNFDVWQRGTSVAMTAANDYTADRWYCETATAGTDKTVSREDGTGVNGSYYCARVKMVSDVDELLTFSQALESQDSIKFRGQKVTLSFYARGGAEFVADNATLVSKIVTGKGTDQKVLAFTTSADGVSQNNTLTTSWQKFTCTTTAAIASDITQIGVSFSFTHAGAGTTTNYFEVTQVQLCAGDVALPFMPKSYADELKQCERYCESIDGSTGRVSSATSGLIAVRFRQKKYRNIANGDIIFIGTSDNCSEVGIAARKFTSGTVNRTGIDGCELTFTGASSMTEPNLLLIYNSQILVSVEL
jgi:hypothetical protein